MQWNVRYFTASLVTLFVMSAATAWANGTEAKYQSGSKYIHDLNQKIIDIIIEDAFSPPVSSRIYTYANLAAYEASCAGFNAFTSLDGQINQLAGLPKPDPKLEYDWRVSSVTALGGVASNLLYTYRVLDTLVEQQLAELKAEIDPAVYQRSYEFGRSVVDRMMKRAKNDGHVKNQASPKYTFPKVEGAWEPTPKNFAEPADPYFDRITGVTITTPDQIPCLPDVPFSKEEGSEFWKLAEEVLNYSKNLTEEQQWIAAFWNDTPGTTYHKGHWMPTVRQINPTGHWINITRIACEQKKTDMMHTIEAYALVSSAMMDGFLACWHAKYKFNVIRPVTYINRYIVGDSSLATWKPMIDTPPFPEYPSGHSTISAAAATVLTQLLGEMPFTDTTEERFGYGTRSFKNFMEAALEASWSRVYGGIHYTNGILNGTEHGTRIGQHVIKTLKTRA